MEVLTAYKMEKNKLDKKLPEKVVAMKAMKLSVVDLKETESPGDQEELVYENEQRTCSLIATDGFEWSSNYGQVAKHIRPVSLGSLFKVEKVVLR